MERRQPMTNNERRDEQVADQQPLRENVEEIRLPSMSVMETEQDADQLPQLTECEIQQVFHTCGLIEGEENESMQDLLNYLAVMAEILASPSPSYCEQTPDLYEFHEDDEDIVPYEVYMRNKRRSRQKEQAKHKDEVEAGD